MPHKYEINPHHDSGNDTLCMALRRLWREGEAISGDRGARIKADAAKAFDFAKRMDAKLKDYKAGRC